MTPLSKSANGPMDAYELELREKIAAEIEQEARETQEQFGAQAGTPSGAASGVMFLCARIAREGLDAVYESFS